VGAYVQLIDASVAELPIPAETDGFKALMAAQARGDREVLEQHGRTVLTLTQ
jgi:glucose-6-phosphate isomerase